MARQHSAHKLRRNLVIIFISLIILIVLFWAVGRWTGMSLTKWGVDIPVISSFVSDDGEPNESESDSQAVTKLKDQVKNQNTQIADLKQSLDNKDKKMNALQDQLTLLQQEQQSQQKNHQSENQQNITTSYKDVADLYKNMSPGKAAAILGELKNGKVVKILEGMKSDAAAVILEKMKPEKAAKLTVLLADEQE